MDCPKCRMALLVVERHGIELDHCVGCKGIWFDASELELLPQALGIAGALPDIRNLAAAASKETPRLCPRCLGRMDKVEIGSAPPLLVDRCPRGDGLWFDHGELGALLDQAGGPQETGVTHFLGETFGAMNRA